MITQKHKEASRCTDTVLVKTKQKKIDTDHWSAQSQLPKRFQNNTRAEPDDRWSVRVQMLVLFHALITLNFGDLFAFMKYSNTSHTVHKISNKIIQKNIII